MKKKYDWDAIRARYEAGENSSVISKICGGRPTRHGIRKRALREGWLSISTDTKQAVRNLPSIQEPSFPRAASNELGKRTVGNARLLLSAVERGAPPKLAADLIGLTRDQIKAWMNDDSQFAMEIRSRAAQVVLGYARRIGDADDWKAWKFLLERSPIAREEYGTQRAEKAQPIIILNIHRDEVVEPAVVGRTEVEQPILEARDEEALPCIDEHELIEEQEPVKKPGNWQGGTFEKNLQSEQRALEARVMGSRSRRLLSPKKNDA